MRYTLIFIQAEIDLDGAANSTPETQLLAEANALNLDEKIERFMHRMPSKLIQFYNFLWLLFEVHIAKAVMFTIFIVCVAEVK